MSAGPTVSPGMSGSFRSANVVVAHRLQQRGPAQRPCVACSASTMSSAAPGSKRSMHSTVTPDCIAAPRISVPPIQKNGNAQKNRGGSSAAPWTHRQRRRGPHDRAVRVHDALRVGARPRRVRDLREVGGHHLGLDAPRAASSLMARVDVGLGFELDRRRPRAVGAARDPDRAERRHVGEEQRRARRPPRGRARCPRASAACPGRARVRAVISVSMSPMRSTLRISAGRYVVASGITERADAARRQPRDHPLLAVREVQADAVPLPMPAAIIRLASRRDAPRPRRTSSAGRA